ncbi:MAG TPA: serine/threonine-protein kinase [Myxococcaceae bacterium]|nr:serine/threonine-protein kinase [Myxococcaceae bacterium]
MAQVYRGLHEALQREVALKELLADVSRDAEAVSRFRREALALAAFRHQNIVTLYDLVEKDTSLFMVMEYVDGPTLAELLRDGPLPPVVAAVIGARVASALDHAHFSRIIHRDIKPANVMITKAGEVKLMDFGIAKDESLEALTREGMAVGTPSYMSPEQVAGDPVDHRTDVYSLGVVLYECLGGVRPFTGKNAGEVFARIRDGRPTPLARAGPRVPKRLRRVVERAMRVNPGRRIQDAARMRHELEYFLARHVTVSHQALLVAFLKSRSRLTETEAMARLSPRELELADPLHQMGLKQRRGWWWAVALGVGGALYAASAFSPGLFGG